MTGMVWDGLTRLIPHTLAQQGLAQLGFPGAFNSYCPHSWNQTAQLQASLQN